MGQAYGRPYCRTFSNKREGSGTVLSKRPRLRPPETQLCLGDFIDQKMEREPMPMKSGPPIQSFYFLQFLERNSIKKSKIVRCPILLSYRKRATEGTCAKSVGLLAVLPCRVVIRSPLLVRKSHWDKSDVAGV